jgi:peptidoglycan/LPS O-acetylase OafA/YrhL
VRRVEALDGVRGVAILLVIAGHAFRVSQFGLGVDVFFVLSGFLITTLLLAERRRVGTVALRRFYARRVRRLGPAVVFYVLFFAVVVLMAAPTKFGGWSLRALASSLYLGNVLRAFDFAQPGWPFGQFWSLAEEEQFYLVWPLLLLVLLARRRSFALPVVAAVAAGSSVLAFVIFRTTGNVDRVWFGPDTHLEPIAIGCVLALAPERGHSWIAKAWPVGIAIAALIICTPLGSRWLFDGPFEVFPLAVAAVIAAAVRETRANTVLSGRALVGTGRISYSLYLWHLPSLALGPAGLPLGFLAAWVSYTWIEQPFLRRARKQAPAFAPALAD